MPGVVKHRYAHTDSANGIGDIGRRLGQTHACHAILLGEYSRFFVLGDYDIAGEIRQLDDKCKTRGEDDEDHGNSEQRCIDRGKACRERLFHQLLRKTVSDTTHGANERPRFARAIDLRAQIRNVRLDDIRAAFEVVSPYDLK